MTIVTSAKLGITYSCYSSFGPLGRQSGMFFNKQGPWLSSQIDAIFVLHFSQLPLKSRPFTLHTLHTQKVIDIQWNPSFKLQKDDDL